VQVFKDRRVLITGHTGFKGVWLSLILKTLGAKVYGISRGVTSEPAFYDLVPNEIFADEWCFDITERGRFTEVFKKVQPHFIFHLAAQAVVAVGYEDPVDTYKTNIIGTLEVLEALRGAKHQCTAVLVTSDKSYRNNEWVWGYRENDNFGGFDPYGGSKAAAEMVIESFFHSFFVDHAQVRVGVARAGNVVGGGDWARDRLIPDMVRRWACGETLYLRNPKATRPWQHVIEPLYGYLTLASQLESGQIESGESFNFGPQISCSIEVADVVATFAKLYGSGTFEVSPQADQYKEQRLLSLNCDKAKAHLGFFNRLSAEETFAMTAEWYELYYNTEDLEARIKGLLNLTYKQISEYVARVQSDDR
jgi:CDP-glucose 4,6-dehydratase